MDHAKDNEFSNSFEENLKKALTEFLILHLLSERDYYIGELTTTLNQRSDGNLTIVFPYGAIYRLLQFGHIIESKKCNAPDGRRRQYYQITDYGRTYLDHLSQIYTKFFRGIEAVLSGGKGNG